jgi:hypothetical protein
VVKLLVLFRICQSCLKGLDSAFQVFALLFGAKDISLLFGTLYLKTSNLRFPPLDVRVALFHLLDKGYQFSLLSFDEDIVGLQVLILMLLDKISDVCVQSVCLLVQLAVKALDRAPKTTDLMVELVRPANYLLQLAVLIPSQFGGRGSARVSHIK